VKLMPVLVREAKEVGLIFLYFFFCFDIILTLKKLLLADYRIEVQAVWTATIGALIVAKVVIVLDKTRVGTRFDERLPLVLASLYKTLFYMLATALALALEKLFHAYRETGALAEAIVQVWEQRDRNLILAKVICIGLAFLAYHLYAGLDRRLGRGTLRRLVTSRSESPTPQSPGKHSMNGNRSG
jgi:hypothetical protein